MIGLPRRHVVPKLLVFAAGMSAVAPARAQTQPAAIGRSVAVPNGPVFTLGRVPPEHDGGNCSLGSAGWWDGLRNGGWAGGPLYEITCLQGIDTLGHPRSMFQAHWGSGPFVDQITIYPETSSTFDGVRDSIRALLGPPAERRDSTRFRQVSWHDGKTGLAVEEVAGLQSDVRVRIILRDERRQVDAGDVMDPLPEPGTYRLLICRGGCGDRDSTRAYLVGQLVIEAAPFPLEALPADTREHFDYTFTYTGNDTTATPNGCFALAVRQEVTNTYAGIVKAGLILWRAGQDNRVVFSLLRSPDAGYGVSLGREPAELRGSGKSWGSGVANIQAPADSILAWRIGPPDRGVCIDAARRSP